MLARLSAFALVLAAAEAFAGAASAARADFVGDARKICKQESAAFPSGSPKTVKEALAYFSEVRAATHRIASRLGALRPPAALAPRWKSFLASFAVAESAIADLRAAIAKGDKAGSSRAEARLATAVKQGQALSHALGLPDCA